MDGCLVKWYIRPLLVSLDKQTQYNIEPTRSTQSLCSIQFSKTFFVYPSTTKRHP